MRTEGKYGQETPIHQIEFDVKKLEIKEQISHEDAEKSKENNEVVLDQCKKFFFLNDKLI